MDLEFMPWCMERLSAIEYLAYLVIREMGERTITKAEISRYLGCHPRRVFLHLKALQRKGFICYCSYSGEGYKIWWVRKSIADEPSRANDPSTVYLKSPAGDVVTIKRGELGAFCLKQGMSKDAVSKMINGRLQSCYGWRLG